AYPFRLKLCGINHFTGSLEEIPCDAVQFVSCAVYLADHMVEIADHGVKRDGKVSKFVIRYGFKLPGEISAGNMLDDSAQPAYRLQDDPFRGKAYPRGEEDDCQQGSD